MSDTPEKLIADHNNATAKFGQRRWSRGDLLCVIIIALAATLFFLPTVGTRPLSSGHEAKAGLIARQMLDEHQCFVAEINVARINKPMLYYWLVAGLSTIAGEVNEWTVRLPSLFGCVGAALLTWALARNIRDRWTGLVSAGILITMMQFHRLAQTARLDAIVVFSVAAAIFCLWKALTAPGRAWNRKSWLWSVTGYVMLAVGFAAKGPVVTILTGLAIGAVVISRRFTREGRFKDDIIKLHPLTGALVLTVLAGPVFWGMERAWGGGFLKSFFLRENLGRAIPKLADAKQFRKSHSFFYYFATIGIYAAPWSFFIPPALLAAVRRARKKPQTALMLPLLCFGIMLLFLSCVSVKKWLYLVPVFPALAIMCGTFWTDLMRGHNEEGRFTRWYMRSVAVIMIVAGSAVVAALTFVLLAESGPTRLQTMLEPAIYQKIAGDIPSGVLPIMAIAICAVFSGIMMTWKHMRVAFVLLVAATAIGMLYHNLVIEPVTGAERSVREFTLRANEWLDQHEDVPLYVCAGEPYELVFYLNRPMQVIRPVGARAFVEKLRPADSSAPRVHVILNRKQFGKLREDGVALREKMSTPPETRKKVAVVLSTVKLIEPEELKLKVKPKPNSQTTGDMK